MKNMLENKTFIRFFELDEKGATAQLSTEGRYLWLVKNYNDILKSIYNWTKKNYPHTPHVYRCSFATLMVYFATDVYGGYGTENVKKERYAEHKAYEYYKQLLNNANLSEEDMTISLIFFVASHILQICPLEEETQNQINQAIKLLKDSKKTSKSKEVAKAREILEQI